VAGEFKIKKTADDLMAEAAAKPANPSILNNTQAPGKPSQTNQSKKGRNAGKQKR
jgi:YidC/Oxa1 family membrane protein insertase